MALLGDLRDASNALVVGVRGAFTLRDVILVLTAVGVGEDKTIELIDDDTSCSSVDLVVGTLSTEIVSTRTTGVVTESRSGEGIDSREANDGRQNGDSKCEHC